MKGTTDIGENQISNLDDKFEFQKLAMNADMLLCNTFQATMSSKGGMIGGVNCKSGLIYGQYVILQNSYEMRDLSLSEVIVYGI